MALPNVNIEIGNGALGSAGTNSDGIAALVVTGTGTIAMPIGTPKVVYSLTEAEGLGITPEDQPSAHRHIKEFYEGYRFITGRDVAELYLIMVSAATTMTALADVTSATGAKSLLDYAQGRVSLLGITRTPGGEYTPDLDDGIDADVISAIPKAQELAQSFAVAQAPLRVLVEGRSFEYDNIGDLLDLTTMNNNRVGVVLWSTKDDGSASVGYTLGIKSALPVQRKISRVGNGQLSFDEVFIGDTPVEEVLAVETIHDKGYIAMRTFPTRSGYYLSGEPMACPSTDDYAILSRGCVIDKAQRIAFDRFLNEVDEDVEVDADGQLQDGYRLWLENEVKQALVSRMSGEISGEPLFHIPAGQNILSDSTTKVVLKITPKGYQSQIDVLLQFHNPALA